MRRHWQRALRQTSLGLLTLVLLGTGCSPDPANATRVDHAPFGSLIQRFTVARGGYVLLDYRALAGDGRARRALADYLDVLGAVDPSRLESNAERQAFWYNLYNASVILGVLNRFNNDVNYRPLADATFFTTREYRLAGQQVSLDYIEHGVLRGRSGHASVTSAPAELQQRVQTWFGEAWATGQRDLRLHAALNCASLGCPNLPSAAPHVYTAATLETQLNQQTAEWLANEEKGAGPDGISLIFGYYADDFSEGGGVMQFVASHRPGGTTGVDFSRMLGYDITLNDVSKR